MFVSTARIAANQRNAALSTGPKTVEGKEKSRANALKHGLCASVVVPESLELIQRRSTEFFDTLKPQNEVHVWMVEQAALVSIRIERCQRIERRVRDKISLRAELTWDNDRRFEVEVTARSLSKDPAATSEALRRTSHGSEWMIARWAMLAHAGDTQAAWTDEQNKLAFDLLATPHAFREGRKPGVMIDDEGHVIEGEDGPAVVARRQIALLKAGRDVVRELDEAERALASTDLTNEGDPELRRLRRYESTLHSRLRWCIKQIDIQSPYRCADPSLRPSWVVDPDLDLKPADEVAAEVCTTKMIPLSFDLEPDEVPPIGQNPDIPMILSGRKEERFPKAETLPETRRKKVDKLIA